MSMALELRCTARGCDYEHKVPRERKRMVEAAIRLYGGVGLRCPRCGNEKSVIAYGSKKKGG